MKIYTPFSRRIIILLKWKLKKWSYTFGVVGGSRVFLHRPAPPFVFPGARTLRLPLSLCPGSVPAPPIRASRAPGRSGHRTRGAARGARLCFPRWKGKSANPRFPSLLPAPRGGSNPRGLRGQGLPGDAQPSGKLRCQGRPRRGRQYRGPNGSIIRCWVLVAGAAN